MLRWGKQAVETAQNMIDDFAPEQQQLAREILDKTIAIQTRLAAARDAISQAIFGQEAVIEQSLVTLLAGGHALLVGVPGVAKTRLVSTLGHVMGLSMRRVQSTPDLMPADILGSEVLDQAPDGSRHFRFIKGPVFCQLLMADEINRASPRTQSALLQAMQEHKVTVAGQDHALPEPFHVFATQNPLEYEGTYPLPEAQLDRFLMQIDVPYPDFDAEKNMLVKTTGAHDDKPAVAFDAEMLADAQMLVRQLPVGNQVTEIILKLVRAGRPNMTMLDDVKKYVTWGPGPRAAQALLLAARARALINGRLAPSFDDIKILARPVLQHRMQLNYTARADNISIPDLINRLVDHARL